MIQIIDLHFQLENAIASFIVETEEGPVIIETGPHSTFPQLLKELHKLGYQQSDVKHVLLTHIHFDHAGAAWAFAASGATVYVHPVGWKHLQDPTRLYGSAKRIYGDMMETLWGKMEKIPENQLIAVPDEEIISIGGKDFKALHTPGHASHHIAWQLDDVIFTGDVAGAKINNGPVSPPCPPPDIDLEAWLKSIERIRELNPRLLYLTHFGIVENVNEHLDELIFMLRDWGEWIKIRWEKGMDHTSITPEFKAYAAKQLADAGLSESEIAIYEAANPAWMSVAGLLRYWTKKAEADA